MYRNLYEFTEELERRGELVRVKTGVSPRLEIAELTDRESKRPGGGRALFFENTGTNFPVVTNLMGSDRRVAMALGVERLDELTRRIEGLFSSMMSPKPRWTDKLKMLPLLNEMSHWLPREKTGRGVCQQVVWQGEDVDLNRLPILTCWPADGGPFVTLPLVNTVDPETGIRNVGMYRMQLFSPRTTGMHWHLHKTGERHYQAYKRLGRRMPVSVCLGGDPVYTYSATAPMPDNLDEYLLAGFLRKRPVELVKCLTNELRVPADCDFVIEGYVDPAEEKVIEGPFGDHTGFYSLEDRYPLFHVTAVTHRRNAVYPATLVGIPPQEDLYLAKATEKIFLAPIRTVMLPEVRDLWMPAPGVAHNLAVVNIESRYPGQGVKVAHSLWGAGQMMFNKYMLVAAADQDIRQPEVLRSLVRRVRWGEHTALSRGPLDVLDHAAPEPGTGGKLALDLTGIDPATPVDATELPEAIACKGNIRWADASLTQSWGVLMLGAGVDATADEIFDWVGESGIKNLPFILLLDESVNPTRHEDVLWLAVSNTDPVRDIALRNGIVLLDARTKAGGVNGFSRLWPNAVTASADTIARVDARWDEYGLGGFVSSPSLHYRPLVCGSGAVYCRER